MFSGIVTHVGTVRAVRATNRDFRLEVASDLGDAEIGASILHAGCCLTLIDKGCGWHAVEATRETLSCTTLAEWREGTLLNLERPQRMGGEIGGHAVTGHVDTVGRVLDTVTEGGSRRVRIWVPSPLHRYVSRKGSVAVDGVSLTVTDARADSFEICVIPHTLDSTTLKELRRGSAVNIEIDILARYLARWEETRPV